MAKSEQFLPINEASTEHINFALDLPQYLDRGKIRSHTSRIQSMIGLGGIKNLKVETFEADRVSASPLIVGGDSEGGAYAGKVGTPTMNEDIESQGIRGENAVNVRVRVDVQALASKISSEGLRSEAAWAREIDKLVLQGIRAGSVESLLKKNVSFDLVTKTPPFGMSTLASTISNGFTEAVSPDDLLLRYAVQLPAMYLIDKVLFGSEQRASLVWGPQVDRWAILQARTRMQHVVKGFN